MTSTLPQDHPGNSVREGSAPAAPADTSSQWVNLRPWVSLAACIVVIKFAMIMVGWWWANHSALSIRDYESNYHHHALISRYGDASDVRFYELWVASDAQWYLAIADSGYPGEGVLQDSEAAGRPPPGKPKRIHSTEEGLKYAFFPLWPLLIRVGTYAFGRGMVSAFWLSNLCSLAGMLCMFGLFRSRDPHAAWWAVVLMACWPFGMFYDVPFTESLFLLLTVGTVWAAEKERWGVCGACMGLSMITRATGVALPVAIAVLLAVRMVQKRARGAQAGGSDAEHDTPAPAPRAWWHGWKGRAGLLASAIPPGLWLLHNHVRAGNALIFRQTARWWGYEATAWYENLYANVVERTLKFHDLPWHGFHHSQLDVLCMLGAFLLLLIGIRMLSWHVFVYALLVILIPLLTKDLMSFSRYAIAAWPLFFAFSRMLDRRYRSWISGILALLFLLGQAAAVCEFVNWRWVA